MFGARGKSRVEERAVIRDRWERKSLGWSYFNFFGIGWDRVTGLALGVESVIHWGIKLKGRYVYYR